LSLWPIKLGLTEKVRKIISTAKEVYKTTENYNSPFWFPLSFATEKEGKKVQNIILFVKEI